MTTNKNLRRAKPAQQRQQSVDLGAAATEAIAIADAPVANNTAKTTKSSSLQSAPRAAKSAGISTDISNSTAKQRARAAKAASDKAPSAKTASNKTPAAKTPKSVKHKTAEGVSALGDSSQTSNPQAAGTEPLELQVEQVLEASAAQLEAIAAEAEAPDLDISAEDFDGDTDSLEDAELEGMEGGALANARVPGYSKAHGDDAVGAFFKEMARYPLLSASEEIELAREVRSLSEIEAVRAQLTAALDEPPSLQALAQALNLSDRQLEQRLYRARVAKRKMIRSNLRLVVSIAKRYINRGVPFLDLIQEGALGLNRATEKFDPDKGYKFSTYAYWWIRQGITRTIANDARTIRLPIHVVEKLNRLRKTHRDLRKELGHNPTETQLAEALELTVEQLRNLQQVQRKSLSLNHRVGKGEDTELMDLLEDGEMRSPEAMMTETMLRQEMWQVLDNVLTKREKDVISLRYGLTATKPCTLEEVGGMFNLSRERVRQIQNKAMRKLRRPQIAEKLRGWLH
jgi:RNA polymerase primary sigma factor